MNTSWHTLTLLTALAMVGCGQSHSVQTDSGPVPSEADAGDPMTSDAGACCAGDAAPPAHECDGLGPAACLDAFCVPSFDDACCPLCSPDGGVGCADCTRPTYLGCFPREASPCLGGPGCGMAPSWGCGPAAPDCSTAHVVSLETCDRGACVPAFPSGEGDPSIDTAVCVPITAVSCTAFCRRLPPTCPTGTTPEGDGSCFTNRCIPAFVCG